MAENAEIKENLVNPGLTFGLLKGKAEAFVNGEITNKELADWGNTLVIVSSLPIMTKMASLMSLTTKYYYSNTDQEEFIVCELYRNIFFELYLRYLGIENVFEDEINYENYDLMEPLYGPWIEAVSGRDIEMFKNMLRDCINLYASSNIVESVSEIDTGAMKDTLEDNKKVLEKLSENKETIQALKDLVAYNDPMISKVVDELKKINMDKNKTQE